MSIAVVIAEAGFLRIRGIKFTSAVRCTRLVSSSVKYGAVPGGLIESMKYVRSMSSLTASYYGMFSISSVNAPQYGHKEGSLPSLHLNMRTIAQQWSGLKQPGNYLPSS